MGQIMTLTIITSVTEIDSCASCGAMPSSNKFIVQEKVFINAPVDKAWQKINNFGDLVAWYPAFANTEIKLGENNIVGAVRMLTLQDCHHLRNAH